MKTRRECRFGQMNQSTDVVASSGNKLVASLEVMPEDADIPELPYKVRLSLLVSVFSTEDAYVQAPLSLSLIEVMPSLNICHRSIIIVPSTESGPLWLLRICRGIR